MAMGDLQLLCSMEDGTVEEGGGRERDVVSNNGRLQPGPPALPGQGGLSA